MAEEDYTDINGDINLTPDAGDKINIRQNKPEATQYADAPHVEDALRNHIMLLKTQEIPWHA